MSIVLGTYLLLLVILNFQPSRLWLLNQVEASLEEKLDTEIEIGDLEVGLFNRIILKDVVIYDQNQKILLDAGLLSVKVELAPLLKGAISLRTVSVLDADIDLYAKKKGEPANFNFIVEAFKSKENKKNSDIDLRINSIILRRCNVKFNQEYMPETPEKFNISHMGISGLDANISLKKLTPDSLNLSVRSFSFKEKSGLDVRALTLCMAANRKDCVISRFDLALPESRLKQSYLHAEYSLNDRGDFWPTLNLNGSLEEAHVSTDDLVFLLPQLKDVRQSVNLTVNFNINPQTIRLNQLRIDEKNNRLQLMAKAVLQRDKDGIISANSKLDKFYIDSVALVKYAVGFIGKDIPVAVKKLGHVAVDGVVNYKRDGWSSFTGNLNSGAGKANAGLQWKGKQLKGKLNLNMFSLKSLLAREDVPENVQAEISGMADLKEKENPAVEAHLMLSKLSYRGHEYSDIQAETRLSRHKLHASVVSDNENASGSLNFEANLYKKNLSNMLCEVNVENFNPKVLNLTDYFGNNSLSMGLSARLKNFDFKRPVAHLQVSNLNLVGEKPYTLDNLQISAISSEHGTLLKLNSDFGTARLDGPMSLRDFKLLMMNMVGNKLLGLVDAHEKTNKQKWVFKLNLLKSDFFTEILHLPVSFDKGVDAEGFLSADGGRIFVSAVADHLKIKETEITKLRFLLRNQDNELLSRIQADKRVGMRNLHFELENATKEGRLLTDLMWGDLSEGKYSGSFKTETEILEDKTICTSILPTEITIDDSLWKVLPGEVRLQKDSISVRRLEVQHSDQGLKLYGNLSKHPKDSLFAELKKIDVEYIMTLAKVGNFSFSGLATGKVTMANTFDSLQIKASLDVPDFYFNNGLMGHADIKGGWNIKDKRIQLLGDIQEKGVGFTKVSGYVAPTEKKLDLRIDSKNTNVYFLNRYVDGILSNMRGRTTGMCQIYGSFGKIEFGGKARTDVSATIDATGVRYHMTGGDVVMTPGKFGLEHFKISDGKEGTGMLNGHLLHNHLKNLRYKMDVITEDLKVYDKDESLDMPFYATVYGTGRVRINGEPGLMEADIAMSPEGKTMFVYKVDSPESFGDVQFLRFADVADTIEVNHVAQVKKELPKSSPSMDVKLNFLVDMKPEATLKVIVDQKSGDHLLVHGYGPIRASFYNKGNFEMFGRLNVDRGVYKMSIQDVIRKDFEFTKGSFINFSGNPFMGDLGLRAIYTVNSASLSDLNIGKNLSENSVRVNCVLNFTGKVKSPQVSFDLELPSVSEDVQQMVRNLISNEEDMNMQILYLLGVGRFYTYNFSSTDVAENQSQSSVAMKSFLSNTLSSQLNNIISNAVGSSNWSFGANLSTGAVGWSDMEVEGILSGRLLNNRLLINGNFGYRDRPAYSTTTNFVGDFDVRYLLTPGGGVSLKAYSETNDRYFSKSSLTTQGIGLLLKRDFINLKDLFTP